MLYGRPIDEWMAAKERGEPIPFESFCSPEIEANLQTVKAARDAYQREAMRYRRDAAHAVELLSSALSAEEFTGYVDSADVQTARDLLREALARVS